MPADQYPQVELPLELPNIASVMSSAGYNVVYKGKWHCSKPPGGTATTEDLVKYGFARWNPPDAGANQEISEAGGGSANNDGRYMDSTGNANAGDEGAIQYLTSVAAQQQPFCLIISLVNPHDVLLYPNDFNPSTAGYDNSSLRGRIELPRTVNESLSSKPRVQREFLALLDIAAPLPTRKTKRQYINFYGNLMQESDNYLLDVLNTLRRIGLRESTLIIRTSDHGEMGMAHGGSRQKNFNFYEESTRVPLIYSNPRLFKRPRKSKALVSHVDLLPTLAGLFDAPRSARVNWQGVDYSRKILNPQSKPPQNYVVFTYDDFQSGQASGPYPTPPNHIVSIREERWELAKYYDPAGKARVEWEMYDLKRDPLERKNLARRGYKRTPLQQKEYRRLRKKLARVEKTRLEPL
jgi:arylsulfatase A-like enzyme